MFDLSQREVIQRHFVPRKSRLVVHSPAERDGTAIANKSVPTINRPVLEFVGAARNLAEESAVATSQLPQGGIESRGKESPWPPTMRQILDIATAANILLLPKWMKSKSNSTAQEMQPIHHSIYPSSTALGPRTSCGAVRGCEARLVS